MFDEDLPSTQSTEPLVGWRTWRYVHPHYFVDLGVRQVWEPCLKHEARCIEGIHTEVPSIQQHCGIYAFKSKDEMIKQHYASLDTMCYGEVLLWGRVIEHRDGWRGQFAYFKSIHVHPSIGHLIPWLEWKYKVPCHEIDLEAYKLIHPQYRQPIINPVSRQPNLSMEQMWVLIHHQDVPLPVKRMLRNTVRARWIMANQKSEKRLENLYETIKEVKKTIEGKTAKIQHLDELLQEWKAKG